MLFTRRRHKNNLVLDFFVILLYTVFVFFSLIFFCKINTCVVIFLVVYDQRSNISCPRLCMSYITCRISCSSFSVWPIIMAKGKNGCRSTNETVSKAISTEIALMDQSRLENCTQMRCPLTLGKLFLFIIIYYACLQLFSVFLHFLLFELQTTTFYVFGCWLFLLFFFSDDFFEYELSNVSGRIETTDVRLEMIIISFVAVVAIIIGVVIWKWESLHIWFKLLMDFIVLMSYESGTLRNTHNTFTHCDEEEQYTFRKQNIYIVVLHLFILHVFLLLSLSLFTLLIIFVGLSHS